MGQSRPTRKYLNGTWSPSWRKSLRDITHAFLLLAPLDLARHTPSREAGAKTPRGLRKEMGSCITGSLRPQWSPPHHINLIIILTSSHCSISALYQMVKEKAIGTGDVVAQTRRMPGAKSYDVFMESSFIEIYNETARDLYRSDKASLPVYEDDLEGYQLSSLSYRMSKNEQEMRQSFNLGRHMRDSQSVGNVQDRACAIFSIHVYQYSPAVVMGEEDSVRVSRIVFVVSWTSNVAADKMINQMD